MAESLKGTAEELSIDDSDVPDWLLTEILQRLPVKRIFMFKSVSKRWFSLVSDPYFARAYNHRINDSLSSSSSSQKPWNLIFRYLFEVRILSSSMAADRVVLRQNLLQFPSSPGFSLSFLPSQQYCPIKILASSNGLLLCSDRFYWQQTYYVCNPITQKWISLPQPRQTLHSVAIGFFSHDDGYLVVRIPTAGVGGGSAASPCTVKLETFTSKTGEWNLLTVECPFSDYYIKNDCPVVQYKGKLHWLELHRNTILAYPTNRDAKKLCLMNLPRDRESEQLSILGACQDHLRYFEVTDTLLGPRNLLIWVHETEEWHLEYRIQFSDFWSSSDELKRIAPKDGSFLFPLALHPLDLDVVYLGYGGCLVSYNVRTGTVEVVRRNIYSHQLIALVLPPWPTEVA